MWAWYACQAVDAYGPKQQKEGGGCEWEIMVPTSGRMPVVLVFTGSVNFSTLDARACACSVRNKYGPH